MGNIAGIVKNHMRYCSTEDCKCSRLNFKESDETYTCNDVVIHEKGKEGEEEVRLECKEDISSATLIEALYEILNMTLRNMCSKEQSAGPEIIQAYINNYKLNNMFKALYNLMLAEEANISFFQEYMIYCLRYKLQLIRRKSIELCMLEEERRNTSSLRLDFNKMVTFHQKYMTLHDLVSQATSLYSVYWAEYLKAQPGTKCGIQHRIGYINKNGL